MSRTFDPDIDPDIDHRRGGRADRDDSSVSVDQISAETGAIQQTAEALVRLDHEKQIRVLRYLLNMFQIETGELET